MLAELKARIQGCLRIIKMAGFFDCSRHPEIEEEVEKAIIELWALEDELERQTAIAEIVGSINTMGFTRC